ncbi:hypothetical protein, partial [Bradyrhizobium ivorense]|uniref:hypothetical protein n=1 Tax=Bradyrhizobium ivorense TaxID=2511166 RepID=UPI001E381542
TPMQSSRRPPALDKALDTSGKSGVIFQNSEIVHLLARSTAGGIQAGRADAIQPRRQRLTFPSPAAYAGDFQPAQSTVR